MGVPAAAEMYRNVGTFLVEDSEARLTAFYTQLLAKHFPCYMFLVVSCVLGDVTCIPVHDFVCELPVAFQGPQRLPFFPLQRVLRPGFRGAECALETLDGTFAPADYAFVVCFEEYAHGVYDGICAFEMLCV